MPTPNFKRRNAPGRSDDSRFESGGDAITLFANAHEVGGEQNSTIIFPMPLDIIKPFLEILDKKAAVSLATPIVTNGAHTA